MNLWSDEKSLHRNCCRRGLVKYPSIDKKIWDPSSSWILQWDNIVKHPGARARGCQCDVHKPPWLYPDIGIVFTIYIKLFFFNHFNKFHSQK